MRMVWRQDGIVNLTIKPLAILGLFALGACVQTRTSAPVASRPATASQPAAEAAVLDDAPIAPGQPAIKVAAENLGSLDVPPNPDFSAWLREVRDEARRNGIRETTLEKAFNNLQPIPRVLELDRNQPEFKLTYRQYMERVVPQARVEKGRKMLAENRALIEPIARKYGVPANYLVAFWGVETDFGRVTGGFQVIPALATLAHDGRRSAFFRKELMFALQIVDEGNVTPDKMTGSWAGAMGQCQFMPSSFVRFAVDANGDGRKDLWTDKGDVFASAANYLGQSGWKGSESWGRAVTLPKTFDRKLGGDARRTFKTWAALGVRDAQGKPLPPSDQSAALIIPDIDETAAFLVTDNYFTILKWNRSTFYALAVGQLADALAKR
jgi:membrane-bound lytic murein transglycosylase B